MAEFRHPARRSRGGTRPVARTAVDCFAQFVQHCRGLAVEEATVTGRSRDELLRLHPHPGRNAERAYQEKNQTLDRECWQNLDRYATHFTTCAALAAPDPLDPTPSTPSGRPRMPASKSTFRNYLTAVWKEVRVKGRKDLDERPARVARQSQGLAQRLKEDPDAAWRSAPLRHRGGQGGGGPQGRVRLRTMKRRQPACWKVSLRMGEPGALAPGF